MHLLIELLSLSALIYKVKKIIFKQALRVGKELSLI
jgi:hypothetical protein